MEEMAVINRHKLANFTESYRVAVIKYIYYRSVSD